MMADAILIACTLVAADPAYQATVEVRETAGVARRLEPVVLTGADLVTLWGAGIDTRRIRVADHQGRPVPCQVDERDGRPTYAVRPNHRLDADDEIVWQATLDAGATGVYRVFLAEPGDRAAPAATDLRVEPAPKGAPHSAAQIMHNTHMDVGVRGWPVDKKRFSGCGAGAITYFRLFGKEQVFQGEGHNFFLYNGFMFDPLYNRLEVVARGPVRAILQVRGPTFNGRKHAQWSRYAMHMRNGRAVRTYALYNGVPWLECREAVRGDWVHPHLVTGGRFLWRPGGRPFHKESRLYMPSPRGTIAEYKLGVKDYGASINPTDQAWVTVLRPDGPGVPVFFFDPRRTWVLWAQLYEPWMKQFLANKQEDRIKSIVDVRFVDPKATDNKGMSWGWAVWGTRTRDPRQIERHYRAWQLRPLRADVRVLGTGRRAGSPVTANTRDTLCVPPRLHQRLAGTKASLEQRAKAFTAFARAMQSRAPDAIAHLERTFQAEQKEFAACRQALLADWDRLDWKTKADWRDRYHRSRDREPGTSLTRQQFDLWRDGAVGKGYRVLVTDNFHKVFRTLRSPGRVQDRVDLNVARREGESIQLAVVPMLAKLSGVQVVASAMKQTGGATIPASAWSLYRVGDVKPPDGINKLYGKPEGTRWPDPLMPIEPFDCPGSQARAVLATLYVPADAAAGPYTGTLTVQAKGVPETVVSVRANVLDFTLPERRTMLWDSWYDMDTVRRHYGEHGDLATYTKNMQMLARYRAVPGLYGWCVPGDYVRIWRENDGRFTFDFAGMDRWLAVQQRYGNLWNPNLSCNSGWFSILHGKHLHGLVRDRATGKKLTLADIPERSKIDKTYTLIYEQFMKAYVAHLKRKGWLKTAWHEKWDEPVRERIEPCKQHHRYLMKLVPSLQLMAWGLRPITDAWATGLTHAWAPNLNAWYEQWPGSAKRRKAGDKLFVYTCGAHCASPDRTVMCPDINIWDPNAQRRVYPWIYHQLKVDGMLIFTMTGWPRQGKNWGRDRATRWPTSDWVIKGTNTYWWVYPGRDGWMVPSLRLDALRDGLEDYEFIHAATQHLARHPNPQLAKLLEVDASIVIDREAYAQDKATYDRRRAAIARFLVGSKP